MSTLPRTSRAAVLVEYNQPLEICELAVPPLEPGAILVKVEAATVCGSDVHASHGRLTQVPQLPLVPGHENNQQRFSFLDLISNTYRLEEANTALQSMARLQEIKPAILPS
jgi:Zn-dependent alcohol dehydrogenase